MLVKYYLSDNIKTSFENFALDLRNSWAGLVSINLNWDVIEVVIHRILELLKTLTNPLDKTQLQNCEIDIGKVHKNMLIASTGA
ncbi:hypothetical protein SO802_006663, partial [Lithocarpus litseifolius]